MRFYEVWVASQQYHGSEPLTYQSEDTLSPGDVVVVPLKNKEISAIVSGQLAKKPNFKVKDIVRNLHCNIGRGLDLLLWLLHYYPAPSGIIASLFVPGNFPGKLPEAKTRPVKSTGKLPPLTSEQKQALDKLKTLKSSGVALLHGETGTGKTRVYVELAKRSLESGKSSIILTPEIGLTPQLVSMFEDAFDGEIITLHSKLTAAQRRNRWLKIAQSITPLIVIGPRSALFAPVKDLGLVIIDEAHDNSYKQDQSPHYLATRVASKLAALHGGKCIFGTATPKVSDYQLLKSNNTPVIRMTKPVNSAKKPKITVVDRRTKGNFKKSYILSDQMIDGIEKTINKKQQALIFLNRRGTARLVVCQNCGWEAQCPNCDVPLTYHKDDHQLRCHICSYKGNVPTVCPSCDSSDLSFRSAGSKALWDELAKLFPDARIKRFDSDNKPEEALAAYNDAIKKGDVDILVGTQILAKGLDIPKLTFVGIPFADTSLYLPDFTADEQTYQLLSQVIGRVGRRNLTSSVVVQTFSPDNPIIKAALSRDWSSFLKSQLKERKAYDLPPYTYLLQLKYSKKRPSSAKDGAERLAKALTNLRDITVLGPTPAFYGKTQGVYNWSIVVKAKNRQKLLQIIKQLPSGWRYDIDPVNLL